MFTMQERTCWRLCTIVILLMCKYMPMFGMLFICCKWGKKKKVNHKAIRLPLSPLDLQTAEVTSFLKLRFTMWRFYWKGINYRFYVTYLQVFVFLLADVRILCRCGRVNVVADVTTVISDSVQCNLWSMFDYDKIWLTVEKGKSFLAYIQILCSYAQMKFSFLFGESAFGQWYLTNFALTLSGVHKRKHPVTFLYRILGDIHLLNSSNTLYQKWRIKALTRWPCLLAGSGCSIDFRWTRSTFIVW